MSAAARRCETAPAGGFAASSGAAILSLRLDNDHGGNMIGYANIGTNDLSKATAFYDALFGEIGIGRLMEFPTGAVAYGGAWDKPMLAVGPPYDGKPATVGNGTMIALVMDERAKVDALHAKALALGGTDEGAPGVRGEEGNQAFYGAYFRDLDGNKFCAFRVGPG